MVDASLADVYRDQYAQTLDWLQRPYEHRELVNDLFRLYLLLGPVKLDFDADFDLRTLSVRWSTEEETNIIGAKPGATLRNVLDVHIDTARPLDDFGAYVLATIFCRYAQEHGWQNFPTLSPGGDSQRALKQILHEYLTRYGLLRQHSNPVRLGEVNIEIYPSPFGYTRYVITIGDQRIPGVVRGTESEALEVAKNTLKLHTVALGELL
jgi:hypothetical protein